MSTKRITLDGKAVQIGARARDGRVAVGVAIGSSLAAAVVTPAKAERIAADMIAAANKVRASAARAKRQRKGGFLRRFLPW